MNPYLPPGPRQPLVVGPAIVAPLLLLFAGVLRIVDRLDGAYRTAPVWDLGHAMLLFAFVLFGVMVIGLGRVDRQRRSPRQGRSVLGAVAGMTALAGAAAGGWASVGMLYPTAAVGPGTGTVVITGLVLLVVGATAQLVPLVERGALPVVSPLAVIAGAAVALFDLDLLPLAAGILLVGLVPLTTLRLSAEPASPLVS